MLAELGDARERDAWPPQSDPNAHDPSHVVHQQAEVRHPDLPTNELGLTRRDYEGAMSTLCAGCGHDSVTAAIIAGAAGSSSLRPEQRGEAVGHRLLVEDARPTSLSGAHGFNARARPHAVGGDRRQRRQPATCYYIGVSGDGDSLSIGFGQFAHVDPAQREHAVPVREQRRLRPHQGPVLGLGRHRHQVEEGRGQPAGAGRPVPRSRSRSARTFIARSFSGDKEQLVPLIKAGLMHKGFAMIDVISPCVTFNDHVGSTKSYTFTREHYHEAVHADYIPPRAGDHGVATREGEALPVQMHDGSQIVLRKLDKDYDPTHRGKAFEYLRTQAAPGRARHRADLRLERAARRTCTTWRTPSTCR
ncbi:MAG: 2-oxoacid:ferredoxin oxidoreductase subunit beta [Desulfobacterales bacterium]|nr:2-oxoacid:ferredoxin oxidoreductase subunit beta [Desulfobacterales bacterium]